MHVVPFVRRAFLKLTADEILRGPTGAARPLPLGRDGFRARTGERGERSAVESETRTTSGEHNFLAKAKVVVRVVGGGGSGEATKRSEPELESIINK